MLRYKYGPDSLEAVSRFLLGAIFVVAGVGKIVNWSDTAGYMQSQGMFAVPVFLALAIVIEALGGLALWFGIQTRAVALLLTLYLVPVTLIFHPFWSFTGQEGASQLVNFLKNISIMGGLLHVVAYGAGRVSVDASSYHAGRKTVVVNRPESIKKAS